MLVYFINHSTAPVNLGGAERSMITLVEDWYAEDPTFEAFFITKAPTGKFVEAIEARGWGYLALPYLGWAVSALPPTPVAAAAQARDDYAATLRIIEEMEQRRPDLVVTNTLVAPWGAFAAKTLGIPHVWFVREFGDLDHGLEFLQGRERTLEDIGLLSESVFVNSLALSAHVGASVDPAKVSVVYPRVDIESLGARSLEPIDLDPFPAASPESLRIAMVGRISEAKGQLEAVEAVALLRDSGVDARLCLVGASEPPGFETRVHELAERLGVADRITITGEQSNPFPVVRAADVCVTASRIEAFGRTTLEYLALGKPVVASRTGGSAELIEEGESGYLYQPGDAAALATALSHYSANRSLIAVHGRAASTLAESIRSRQLDNRGAIAAMTATAGGAAYRLPNVARLWFALAAQAGPLEVVPTVGLARKVARRMPAPLKRALRRGLNRGE